MNKVYRCRTRNLAPVHSRRARECYCEFHTNGTLRGLWADFCGLPIISDKARVVDPPLEFKRAFFGEIGEQRRSLDRERIAEIG
ncbi:hypothetical protein TNCV_2036401 [Trichonephila clavipes]|nr:hypothetical protein TNCV_2036401 [Trichonephila clavipes]